MRPIAMAIARDARTCTALLAGIASL